MGARVAVDHPYRVTTHHPARAIVLVMPAPWNGTMKFDVRDSTPDWTPYLPPTAPDGAPNVLIVLYDDTGLAAWEPYGGRIRMPTMQRLAENGAHVHAVAHDRAVLADALLLPHRPQPPPDRVRLHRRGRRPATRARTRTLPRETATIAQVLREQRLEHVLDRQGPQRAGRGGQPGRPEDQLAALAGLRPLLRVPRRRDQPVVSDAGRGQPPDRAAEPARGGLPLLQGRRRPGVADAARQPVVGAVAAVVHVAVPRRQSRTAPRRPRVGGQVQGRVRRRLRGLPRVGPGAHEGKRHHAAGHGADAAQPDARGHVQPERRSAALGLAVRRREAPVCPHGRGLRRLLRVHRPPDRPGDRLPRGVGPTRQHDRPVLRRQWRLWRGQPARLGQREQVLQQLARRHGGEPQAPRRPRQPEHLQPLSDRLGRGVLDAVQDVQALLVRGRHLRPAGDPLAEGHRRARRGPPPVPPRHRHRPDDPRLLRRRVPGRLRRVRAGPARRHVDALLVRLRRRADRPRSASTTRCSARAACGRRAGRRSPCMARRRASATSTRTSGSSTTSRRTAPRRTTSRPSIPTSSRR